ncbi:hypothetical protein FOMPIDRAFT_1135145 [Fomitopsis schrenkii]|uniref:G-protein coupled receptors family 1 profile domain-containing protein n=1 Tax=Fomitopsis schrenkii TaxID=2126942 RepID=S8DRY7_FOMSC|nr:hypothetical protein FOMPIDRAFT_1135145 [Fomitopsis schrenkii]
MSSLSDADVETLRQIGEDTVKNIVSLVVEAILWTIYFVLTFKAGLILLFVTRRSLASIWIFAIIVLMFLLDTATSIIDVNNAIREITLTLTSDSPLSLSDRYALTDSLPWPVQSSLYAFESNLGDVIIIWRTYAFWRNGRERWMLALPTLCLVGSLITSGLISFCAARVVQDPGAGDFDNPPFCKNVQLSSYVTTLATTAVATLMICYKTWEYRHVIGGQMHRINNRKTRVERILALLIESGVIYFLFFLEAVITDTGNIGNLESSTPQLAFASQIWTYMTSHILGIYPVVVVILVHSQKSYIEDTTIVAAAPSDFASGSSRSHWGSRPSFPRVIQIHQTHAVELDALDCADPPRKRTIGTVSDGTGSTSDLRLAADFKESPDKRFTPGAVV